MGALVILLLGVVVAGGLWTWLASHHAPSRRVGGTSTPLGLRSPREIVEARESLEAEDLAQMIAARNARRRRRGESEETLDDIERRLAADASAARRELARGRGAAERDLDDLLAVTNARRAARGLPARTRAEAEAELGRPVGGRG